MVRVLIFGKDSYIGSTVEKWLLSSKQFEITTVDAKNPSWKQMNFSLFDCVFDVAGIAHDSRKKKDASLYYKVNRDLTIELAHKAKDSHVKQFIFMSSMLVYNGLKNGAITKDTTPKIKGCYGDSKLQADKLLQEMDDDAFHVAIVRPPMIFGPKCKGNYPRLSSLSQKMFLFPKFKNQRSMLFIDNLCEFIKLLILSEKSGIFFPQNKDYFSTSEIVLLVRKYYGKTCHQTVLFNWLIYLLLPISSTFNKMFGNLTYSKDMSACFNWNYIVVDNVTSIAKAEAK